VDRWQGLASGLSGIVPNLRHKPWLAFQVPALLLALTWHALRLGREADVIHAHWVYPSGIAGLLAARRNRKPLVITSHGGDLNLAARVPPLRALAAFVARRADACLGVSRALVERYEQLGLSGSNAQLVPLGVRIPDGREQLPELSEQQASFAKSERLRVLYVGSLTANKSVESLVRAGQQLKRGDREVAIAVVGIGPMLQQLRALSIASGDVGIHFAGECPPSQVHAWMSAADVVVLPSKSEGRPTVIMEAMGHGRAVVASDIPGIRELVTEGVTGLLFTPGDHEALARCIARLIDEPALARQLGESGRHEFTRQELSSDAAARRHVAIYLQLASTSSERRHK
jgi:glycosyltransferase involved in cell wall biosynthesis